MRAVGTKSSLVKTLKDETNVSCATELPTEERKTAVVVDAMHAIRQSSFQQEETFGAIARRYKHNLLNDVPPGTEIIHFCCDRYSRNSLKMAQQQHRYAGSGAPRVFQVSEQFQAPDPVNFFSVSANKAGLLNFLCETWSEDEQMEPSMGSTVCTLEVVSMRKQRVYSSQTAQLQMWRTWSLLIKRPTPESFCILCIVCRTKV